MGGKEGKESQAGSLRQGQSVSRIGPFYRSGETDRVAGSAHGDLGQQKPKRSCIQHTRRDKGIKETTGKDAKRRQRQERQGTGSEQGARGAARDD